MMSMRFAISKPLASVAFSRRSNAYGMLQILGTDIVAPLIEEEKKKSDRSYSTTTWEPSTSISRKGRTAPNRLFKGRRVEPRRTKPIRELHDTSMTPGDNNEDNNDNDNMNIKPRNELPKRNSSHTNDNDDFDSIIEEVKKKDEELASNLKKAKERKIFTNDIIHFLCKEALDFEKRHTVPCASEKEEETKVTEDSNDENENEEKEISFIDFLKHVLHDAKLVCEKKSELWEKLRIEVIYKNKEGKKRPIYLSGLGESYEDLLNEVNNNIKLSSAVQVSVTFEEKTKYFKPPFKKIDIDTFFDLVIGNLEELKKYLEERMTPISSFNAKIITPNLEYVDVEDDAFGDNNESTQIDKSFAIVVSGESGSGKSVYSCLKSQEEGYLPVYCVIGNDRGTECPKKPSSDFERLENLLRQLIHKYTTKSEEKEDTGKKDMNSLCAMKAKLNTNRNMWAQKILDYTLEGVLHGNSQANKWLDGAWQPREKPEKVAIIIDEATDVDLAEGLVATVRESRAKYKKLAKEDLLLVIVGTGLDAIRYPGRVGTNPENSRLVKIKSPNLNKLREKNLISKEIYEATNCGIFSKVMMTNSRMLFRSVLPILSQDYHKVDEKSLDDNLRSKRLEERLTNIASFGPLMDHSARFYVNQNSIADLKSCDRNHLLKQAFLYHLQTAITSSEGLDKRNDKDLIKKKTIDVEAIQKRLNENYKDDHESGMVVETGAETTGDKVGKGIKNYYNKEEIFYRGIAARSETSNALKYLSCFGLTCNLRPGFGEEFEELTALHYIRLMQVQGYETSRVTLIHAWPPKSYTTDIGNDEIDKLKETLKIQEKDEWQDFDFTKISIDKKKKKFIIIFSQGLPTAQGGDILVLVYDGEQYRLDCIQCKHWKNYEDIESAWESLGVAYEKTSKVWIMKPDSGKAGYSFAALDYFRCFLGKKVGEEVKFGKRIVAMSVPVPPRAPIMIPDDERTEVWFKEMLEPTISVLKPKKASK